jgi:hypothetical protein
LRVAAGAATAGIAYHAGKRRAADDQAAYGQAAYEQAPVQQAPVQQMPAQPAPAAGGPTAELGRLVSLHQSGAHPDDEFAAAKARVLGG